MSPGIELILLTKLNLSFFLPISRQMLGYGLAKAADSADLSEQAHQLACIAAFKDEKASPTVAASIPYLNLVYAGFLVAADERDLIEILEIAKMPFVYTETLVRGIDTVIISGSLAQWRDAVKYACHPKTRLTRGARYAFNIIYKTLCNQGLKDIFEDLRVSKQSDQTFLLEC